MIKGKNCKIAAKLANGIWKGADENKKEAPKSPSERIATTVQSCRDSVMSIPWNNDTIPQQT